MFETLILLIIIYLHIILEHMREENKEKFVRNANIMWNIKFRGDKVSLPVNIEALKEFGLLDKKIEKIEKALPSKNVNYYIKKENHLIKIFLEESQDLFDWKQNFMFTTVKVKIGFDYRRYHSGFFLTAVTVFRDLLDKGLLKECDFMEVYSYSHGAGAAPAFASLVYYNSPCLIDGKDVHKFEPPRDIFQPNMNVRKECSRHNNYIQGNDIVTKVPWWMKHLGVTIKIKGQKLRGLKGLIPTVFDHDIYWTDKRRKEK